ncbi:Arc domain-containing protein [Brucella intermedia]|nr:Arc domain-containing protein [Brucella intermedia]
MKIRIPPEIKQWLAREAARNLRTQNAEVVLALKARIAQQNEKSEASA